MQIVASVGAILSCEFDDTDDILKMKHSRSGSSTVSEMMGIVMHWLVVDCDS